MQQIVTELQANQNNTNTSNTNTNNIHTTDSGSTIYSGSTEWTHSGILLAELTGSGMSGSTQSGSTYTGILVTPRDAYLYISSLFDQSTSIIHDFVALQVTAVHGYFSEIWTEKVNTRELVASGATIGQAHVETLCVKKSNGTEFCLTGDQLESILGPTASAPESNQGTTPPLDTGIQDTLVGSGVITTGTGDASPTDSGSIVPDTITESGSIDLASAPEVVVPPENPVIIVTDSGANQP